MDRDNVVDFVMNDPFNAADEITRLRRDCAELYQVIGVLTEPHGDLSGDAQCVKALDNASAAADGEKRPHDDLLPFTAGLNGAYCPWCGHPHVGACSRLISGGQSD